MYVLQFLSWWPKLDLLKTNGLFKSAYDYFEVVY